MFLNENIPSFTIALQVICFILFYQLSEKCTFYYTFFLLFIIHFRKPIEFQKYALRPPSFLFRDLKGRTYIDCHSSNSHGTHRSLIREITALIFHSLRGLVWMCSVQFSSVAQSCPTLCDPMNRSTPGLPVHHQLRASMV